MDFHSLSRKDLQTLCKKNKIPANITNVAMADALAALPQVEGLDEFLNPREADAGAGAVTPDIHHRTAGRTSTRRKAVREEPESTKVSSRLRRGSRAKTVNVDGVEVEQENKDSNVSVPVTPAAVPGSRRRASAVSTRRKKEVDMPEDDGDDDNGKNGVQGKPTDVPKTPAAAAPCSRTRATGHLVCTKTEILHGGTTSVQTAYNTRRSVRLLEKNLSKMSLLDSEDMGPAKIDDADAISKEEMSDDVSQQTEDSAETEKVNDARASLQTVSTVVSEKTDELEVSSLEKNINEYECQSHDWGSEVQLVSGTENDLGAGLQAEPQEEGLGKVNCLESEPHDSNLKVEGSSEINDDSNEVRECCDESVVDLNKLVAIGEAVHADNEAGSELLSELEGPCDSSVPENKDCLGTKQDALFIEASEYAFMEVTDPNIAALAVVVPDDASKEVTDQDVAGSLPVSSVSDASVILKELVECKCNTDNQGNNEGDDNLQDEDNEAEHLDLADGNYIQKFEPMHDVDEKAADEKDLASPEGIVELVSSNLCRSGEHQQEELEAKSEHSEDSSAEIEKMDNASDVTGASSAVVAVEKDSSSENCIAVIEVCSEASADESVDAENVTLESSLMDVGVHEAEDLMDNSEKLKAEAQPEDSEEHAFAVVSGASSAILAVEMDATSDNSVAFIEFCSESSADESMDAENVTLESSLLDVGVHEAENMKDNSEKLKAKAQPEDSEEHAAGEETALDAASAFPSVPGGIYNPQRVSVESAGNSLDSLSSGALMSVLSCNSNTMVDDDVISEGIAIPRLESLVTAETKTVAPPIHEQKTTNIPIQSIDAHQLKGDSLCPPQAETKGVANEIQTVPKLISTEGNVNMMKENLTTDELHKKSMGELRKMLKTLTLDGSKSNCKEVERKRIALQALPKNRLTNGEAQND